MTQGWPKTSNSNALSSRNAHANPCHFDTRWRPAPKGRASVLSRDRCRSSACVLKPQLFGTGLTILFGIAEIDTFCGDRERAVYFFSCPVGPSWRLILRCPPISFSVDCCSQQSSMNWVCSELRLIPARPSALSAGFQIAPRALGSDRGRLPPDWGSDCRLIILGRPAPQTYCNVRALWVRDLAPPSPRVRSSRWRS